MSYEADRENEAVGPDEPTEWDLWREGQGLGYDSELEDWTPCPKCGGNEQKPCTCPVEFKPLRQATEDEFAKAVADTHFEGLLKHAYAIEHSLVSYLTYCSYKANRGYGMTPEQLQTIFGAEAGKRMEARYQWEQP